MGCSRDKAPGRRELRAGRDLGTGEVREGAVWVSGRSVFKQREGLG